MNLPPAAAATATLGVGASVLGAAGLAKLVRPGDTARALRAAGLPAPASVVRLAAFAETVAAVSALAAAPIWAAGLIAASYVAFAAFVAIAIARGTPLASCGCFGEPDTPPTLVHVVLDTLLAGGAVPALIVAPPSLPRLIVDHPAAGSGLAVGIAVAAGALIVALTLLPRAQSEARAAAVAVLGTHATRRPHE